MTTVSSRVWGLVLAALLAGCSASHQHDHAEAPPDTPENRTELARSLARLEIENGGLDEVLDSGAQLGQTYGVDALTLELGRELTDTERGRVREIMREVLAEILTAERWEGVLTEVYSGQFTTPELQSVIDFFHSPAGTKVLGLKTTLNKQIDDKGEAIFTEQLDYFSERVDEELAKSFAELQTEEAP